MNLKTKLHYCVLSLLLSTTLVLLTDIEVRAAADPIESEDSWTLAILPDTQHYVDSEANFPNFIAQTQWVKDHVESHNISFLLHVGDLIENNDALPSDPPNQWQKARQAMDILHDSNPALSVPYAISIGNHDIGLNGVHGTTRDTEFNDADKFGLGSPYASQPTLDGFFNPTTTENTYHKFNAGGQDWLVLALEFGPRTDVVTWANQVVENHPEHEVILVTHAYMDSNNTRLDWDLHGAGTSQGKKNPHSYDIADLPGGVHDGQELWDDLVSQHDNFKYVFSGHVPGTGRLTSFGEDGAVVHQVLADYQNDTGGGNGYMRLLEFKPDGSVQVRTYSPSLDLHDRAFDEEFVLTPLNGIDGDLNQDGELDILDWDSFRNGSLVDLSDMTILEQYALGDLDLDGDNDTRDFLLFRQYYSSAHGAAAFSSISTQIVPEPSSLLLLVFSLVGLLTKRQISQ